MREFDVNAMRRRIGRDEFDRWMVAYHELHLDGSGPAALVAAEVHNSLAPLWAYFGVEREVTTSKDHLPPSVFGNEDEMAAEPADNTDAIIAAAARAYG